MSLQVCAVYKSGDECLHRAELFLDDVTASQLILKI